MLEFFRRYQRYFFIVITIVIVISFSFFGTYSTLSDGSFREQIAFTTVDGTEITRHELDEMVAFINTDAIDKLTFGGAWGPNFMNDGVVAKDFLSSGLGVILAAEYSNDLGADLKPRFEKEKRYSLYQHPEARFIGVESAWNYFSPKLASAYYAMKGATDPMEETALQARTALYLMQRQFPPEILRQVLRYQEKQNSFVTPDRHLDYTDLSLFGYHTAEDWFGPRFLRLVAEFIINAAEIAENKGYHVSKADAIADLIRNSEQSFSQNAKSPNIGVATSQEYFNEQLRRLGMDQNGAANIWRQVMLFRRLFNEMGNSVFVDPFSFQKINSHAIETVEGELFRLPKELRLNNFLALQKFEAYINAVANQSDEDQTKLTVPTTFLPAAKVAVTYPELVQKRYILEVASVNKKALESNVSVKESWDFEVSNSGFEKLKKQFPELGIKNQATRDERFAFLDTLDAKTRARVDAFARSAIVDAHPEWLEKALNDAQSMKVPVGLHEKGGSSIFTGLESGKELMALLDSAPLASEEGSASLQPASKAAAEKLANYTADKTIYYRIKVVERASAPEVLTFAEADAEGVMPVVIDRQMGAYYIKIRGDDPKEFQNEQKGWKPLADVKDIVAKRYYDKLLKNIGIAYSKGMAKENATDELIPDFAATLRLYPYLQEVRTALLKDPKSIDILSKKAMEEAEKSDSNTLKARSPLNDQWKLERSDYQVSRSSGNSVLDTDLALKLAIGDWSTVNTPSNGDLNFFRAEKRVEMASSDLGMVDRARELMSYGAKEHLMVILLAKMKKTSAISLEYLNHENQTASASDES